MILRQLTNEVGLFPINNIVTGTVDNVPSAAQTTILTLTAATAHKIVRIACSGSDYAKYQLYINGVLKETRRSGPERTIDFTYNPALLLNATQILDVKVTHAYTGVQATFDSTIYSII